MSASFKISDMIRRFLTALSAALFLVACNGTGDKPKEIKPTVTLSEGSVDGNSLSFKAVVKNAFAAAYMCVPESEATPTSAITSMSEMRLKSKTQSSWKTPT